MIQHESVMLFPHKHGVLEHGVK